MNRLIEASAEAARVGDNALALEKAKDAGKRERALCKHAGPGAPRLSPSRAAAEAAPHVSPPLGSTRTQANGLVDQINIDLTYAVCFNLANAYHRNKARARALPRPLVPKPSRPPI